MLRSKLPVIVLILALLTAYIFFGTDYMKRREEHRVLADQIAQVSETIVVVPQPAQDLEERLAAAKENLATEQSKFPDSVSSTEIIDTILKLADESEVKAIPLVTEPWSTKKIGEHEYRVFRLHLRVEGSFLQLVYFVNQLESGELEALVVEDLSVTRDNEQAAEHGISEGTVAITASLNLAIYARPLTSD